MSLLEFLLIDFISRINSNQHENDSNERVDNSSYEEIKTKVDISLKTENNDLYGLVKSDLQDRSL